MIMLALFVMIPVALIAGYSLGAFSLMEESRLTLDAWQRVFEESRYLDLFIRSVRTAGLVVVITVILAFTLAYALSFRTSRFKYVLLFVVLAPALMSGLLRVISWRVILSDQGVFNSFVYWIGLRPEGEPIPGLIFTQTTTTLVLVYLWLPFAVMPIFVTLEALDRRLLEAAVDLGASSWYTLTRVVIPLALPGIIAAGTLIFIPVLGEFIVPILVGGPDGALFGNTIQALFGEVFDWQTGSVLALLLLGAVLAAAVVVSVVAKQLVLARMR